MSLLQRMERAQKAKEAAEAARNGAQTPEAPSPDQPAAQESTAVATAPTAVPQNGKTTTAAGVAVGPGARGAATAGPATPRGSMRPTGQQSRDDLIREVRMQLQAEVVGAFKTLLDAKDTEVHPKIERLVDAVITRGAYAVTRDERERLVEQMVHDVTGFGPLEPLLADPTITEVMVNGPDHIYIERKGKIQRIDSVFLNDQHVLRVIDRIITPLGRRIDESSPTP